MHEMTDIQTQLMYYKHIHVGLAQTHPNYLRTVIPNLHFTAAGEDVVADQLLLFKVVVVSFLANPRFPPAVRTSR